mmetsp:Transcript_103199/g.205074  ORF Transcript_103199/g.205074 Transcript_103199/m.205074 type:complete len:265 (-) Transcript_103199:204-998(-)|eukprot:CAMPEP_0172665366 /NCGR_PEP_ID=MMETSP1074-20121228/7208_1 /TAXON_ID=2916 /ORGANISM="Ceratium fusus, Strain PA161109" /LENGTH=264 /DNA_ID=CAMNT_0013481673 /DNA_START=81 /DNA_END=875 /DNA_ORIENTATION=+
MKLLKGTQRMVFRSPSQWKQEKLHQQTCSPLQTSTEDDSGWEHCEDPISEDDNHWQWSLLEACPSSDLDGTLVIDDYLLVKDSMVPSAHQDSGKQSDDITLQCMEGQEPFTSMMAKASTSDPAAGPGADGAAGPPPGEVPLWSASMEQDMEEELRHMYLCAKCQACIFKEEDILSSNYHAMSGPGYLTAAARSVRESPELQTQMYTTGQYTVREVSCSHCSNVLGVTYVGTADARNRYKVGKFLLGRDRLKLPVGVVHPMEADP